MLKALVPAPAGQYSQRNNRYNTRAQPNDEPDSAIDLSEPASLDYKNGDRNYASMNGLAGASPMGNLYVRALYDYESDDRTNLSFNQGDVIQVITQLESGWWDGMINGVRGWFPSNYCQVDPNPGDVSEPARNGEVLVRDEPEDQVEYVPDEYDEDMESDQDEMLGLPLEGTDPARRSGTDFWIPQATSDGRLYYFNTKTGDMSADLPLESPTSANESGPRDRMNVTIPERTRPPPEMMARGLTQEEDEESDINSASEFDGDSTVMGRGSHPPRARRGMNNEGISPAPSMDSMNGASPAPRNRSEGFLTVGSISAPGGPGQPMLASATSFTGASFSLPQAATIPRSFFDDGSTPPLTWNLLVANMKLAVDRYREAITHNLRSEYVKRAEDTADHLRLILAAGSGTTDNHSGQPSIISTNKALYPHFRDMMSKFSKLVISSHIAAADWPNAESVYKCIQEADGVLLGALSFVEIARQQRGEDIPRLFPGFVIGSTTGGSWQNNGLGLHESIAPNFLDEDDTLVEPTANLDGKLLERLDEYKRMLVSSIRELEKALGVSERIVTPYRHEIIGNNVCSAGSKVVDTFKSWISMIESVDLSPLSDNYQTPQLGDFWTYKQSLYDNIADLMLGCQAVAGPLADEWSEVRGESLESRMDYVRQCARALEGNASHIGFSLQLLSEQVQILMDAMQNDVGAPEGMQREQLRRGDTAPHNPMHQRGDSRTLGVRPGVHQTSQSFSEGDGVSAPTNNYRKGDLSKIKKILGDDPTPQTIAKPEDPPYLRLDLESELSWDTKTTPPSVKGGSLLALVEQLTRHDRLDASFNSTFLLTYRSFTTARDLFELLVKRFNIQPPEGLADNDFTIWRDRKQKPIRFRVVNILKSWFDQFWMEENNEDTKQLIRDVYTFARDTVKSTETPGSTPLMAVLDQRLNGKELGTKRMVQTLSNAVPAPIMPKNMKKLKVLDIDQTEFARQLSIVESKLYGKIKPTECLSKTWQKKVGENDPEPAPNVKALILHSNQMTNWVAEQILQPMDVKKRVVIIKHFVAVADKCRMLNNFSTLTSIISAMGTAPIARLKRTWDQVPTRTNATLETMRKLMASTKNFGEYREALHAANPPCIPFFGVYLTDLTFIEDGIPSIIKKTNHINFAKRAKSAEVIRDIQQYQNAPYSLQPVPDLQEFILGYMRAAGDVHEMYDRSLAIEPREREDEKIVRVLAESGFL